MSNYLVDGADLTSVANAIRTKGGTSAQLAFPQGFVDAVEAIETGGGGIDPISAIQTLKFIRPTGITAITVDLSQMINLSGYDQMFANNGYGNGSGFQEVTLIPRNAKVNTGRMFYASTSGRGKYLTKITIKDRPFKISSASVAGTFGACEKLSVIDGTIDLSAQTYANGYSGVNYLNNFYGCTDLTEIRFVPGSMSLETTAWVWSWQSNLSDESLVSIANALKDTYSGTITFHATPKARLASIMGTVTSDGTLSTFEIDESGTMSLQDFLTTVKGATIA